MTPQVYENLEQLTYGELLTAIDNIREKIYPIISNFMRRLWGVKFSTIPGIE